MVYLTGLLALIAGVLGLYTRGQHYKIKQLDSEKKNAEAQVAGANRRADVNGARAELHKDVARTIVKDGTIAKEKIKQVQEKIDALQENEDFTISI